MAPPTCGCADVESKSMAAMEPTIFPASETGEENQTLISDIPGRLKHDGFDDDLLLSHEAQCDVFYIAWAILLECFTGLDNVCFGFRSEHMIAAESGRCSTDGHISAMQVHVLADQSVQNLRAGKHAALVLVPESKARTHFNTTLTICSLDDKQDGNTHSSSWCKIHMRVDPVTLNTVLSWNPAFMTRTQAESISNTYTKIFREIVAHQETIISTLKYCSEHDERQILAWQSSPMSHVQRCIHQAISEQGTLRPDAEAVCAWDGSFSYAQLLSLSDRLASHLQTLGIGPEVFVPICFDKSKWTVVAMLAILKAGGIFVPLDPTQPLLRLQALSHKVEARTILCSPQHQTMLESVAPELIPVDTQLFERLAEHTGEVDCESWDNGAYMIFTSGTTGEPKGALIQHGALLSSALAHGPAMMMDNNTRSLQFAASTFDVSITEILSCLILGGCVCIPSEEARLNAIEEAITQLQANWALLTPTFVKFINPANVPSLKTLVTGGEAMTQAVIRSWSHINLINCYGPAETSVVSHVHRGMREGKNPLNIGRQVGIHCWVVDRYNHDRLMPIGAVGELVIEGHTLAREYYKEPDKTSEAFIVDPAWTYHQPHHDNPRRMYKTGDLVRYNHDGTFHIAGRKDAQIKFHGQRIELGEIEHHINVSASIKHGMVVLPKKGFCEGRLLAIVQLSDASANDLVPKGQPYKLIDGPLASIAHAKVEETKALLAERLPAYMVPSMWLPLEFIPRLQSGKLDRKQTGKWVEDMTEAFYRQLNPIAINGDSKTLTFSNETESELHKVWTHVLNLKPEQLGLNQSFLSVGGDSISAMQVMSECRKRGLGLNVSHIISCKSITALALQVRGIEKPMLLKESVDTPFGLSPIQKLYFSRPNHDQGHYNQSFLLRTSRHVAEADLRKAMEIIIRRHSMLRARFGRDAGGEWYQRVTGEVTSSYRLRTIEVASKDELNHSLVDSQTCLDYSKGPLIAADLIDEIGEQQRLFVVAHHLVIDLVSWRIILQELEELLLRPEAVRDMDRPLPFQTWCKMQQDHAIAQTPEQALPIHGIPDGNVSYWGMEDVPNVYGQMAGKGFEIGPAQTSLILSKCHEALRTEIPDVLMAAMIFSFGQTFADRPIPAVFAEGHGRESWDPSTDLSNVVGWFTTIYPVFAGSNASSSLIDTIKMVKDGRRKIPDSGRPYFASRWLTQAGEKAFSRHWPLEITFNYLGQYQQLEREGALFTPVGDIAGEVRSATDGADVGPLTTCISLFEVSAVIIKGTLRFSFLFNQNMNHQPEIHHWIASCQQNLGRLIESLSVMAPEPTLSDFPLLSLTYDRLHLLTQEKLPEAGIEDTSRVEDAYPCSPMQSGLLVSTTKDSATYAAYTLHEVKTRSGVPVDVAKLASAWRRMIEYHPMLRTIFVESVTLEDSLYDQVVLKEVQAPLIISEMETDEEVVRSLDVPRHHEDYSPLLHVFEICKSKTGKVFCKLDISHVIMDGTSLSILFRDLSLAYAGILRSDKGPPYSDYIRHLQYQVSEPGIEYWKSYLMGVEPCHFPVLDDGEVVEAKELRHFRVKFDELAQLQNLCDERGVTIVNAIYVAWALVLRLYTASDEVCFGYLTSARDLPIEGIRDVIGPVINMVTCRANIAALTTPGDVMALVQKDFLDSLDYRHIPLAQVQHALQLSDTALFNTALSYRKLPPVPQNPPDIVFDEVRPTYDPDEYNVSVNIEAGEDDMAVDLMYWSDTMSDGQATNVANAFTTALSNILHHADRPVAQLDHLGPHHRQQISQWNQHIPEAVERCVHDLFQQQGMLRPDAPAIASWDMDFTYAELDEASTKLAHHIAALGVGLETFVLVCFDKSAFAVVAMLAILKAGGACVPLDPGHPDAAIKLRAEDTRAPIALVSAKVASRFNTIVDTTVVVDSSLLQTISQDVALPQVKPHNACFVIYTSGSTGRPKGVVLEHRGLATNAMCSGPKLGYSENSRVLQFASYTFDNSLAEIFSTFTLGGCVCVPSEHERFHDLAGAINRYRVTMVDITPTVACLLHPADVPTLKTLALGGEAVTHKCVSIWRDFVSLQCCYGPSECSVNSTYSGEIAQPGKATNIGRAVGSVTWVVDAADHSRLVPIGCVGELLIDGPIVSRGYLNLPEKMAESFVAPPAFLKEMSLTADMDRKLYKTGDLVRYNFDGTLTYLGRKDTQVKLHGQRIELEEIEHHIEMSLPQGWDSAVELVVFEGRKALACFICADVNVSHQDGSEESTILPMDDSFRMRAKDLEIVLLNAIPAYMIPSVWFPVSKMPMTSSGKLNRRALRSLAQAVPTALITSYKLALKSGRAPSSDMEKQLAGMWAKVLNIDVNSIGVEDHFFRLGGDSIAAMQLVTLARKSNINLTVTRIFQKVSLLDMAQSALPLSRAAVTAVQPFSLVSKVTSLDALQREVAAAAQVNVAAIEDIYPCTAIQEGLMALSAGSPGAYVAQFIFRIPDGVDMEKFKMAWQLVIQAEPTLRTRLVQTTSVGVVNVVVVDDALQWSTIGSLSGAEESRRQIPLHNGARLADYGLVEDGSEVLFVWTIHHALYDGWCLPLILDKVKQCYQSLQTSTQQPSLSLSGPKYSTFIRYLTEVDASQDTKFWGSYLSDISTQHFPRLPTPDYKPSASGLIIHKTDFKAESTGSGITTATMIRAAWALTVSTYSAADTVVFWETVTGRDAPVDGIEDMVGATLATVPICVRLDPSQSVTDLLDTVQSQSAAVRMHQFAGIHRISRISSDTAFACAAQNLLAINYGPRQSTDSFWCEETNEMAGTNFYSYPLMLSCHVADGELETVVHFDPNIVSESQMQRIMDQFALMLTSVTSSELKGEHLSDLEMINARDYQTLSEMSRLAPSAMGRLVHDVIKATGDAQPHDKLAVCAWNQNLTYSELDSQATRLASILIEAGVGANSFVPFCMEKSSLVVVSMLAILKAGAAFVPLDYAHPDARISGILDDVEATIILSSPQYAERLTKMGTKVMPISSTLIQTQSSSPSARHAVTLSAKCPAYCIFTSGTTGKPKGTIIDHSAFCTGATAHGSAMGMNESSRVLQFASHTFDASIMETLSTLIHGGTVCVPSEDERMHDIAGAINRMGVNWALLTPSVAQLIEPSVVPGLKTLVLGGEAMSRSHISAWAPSVQLMNAYGPSETSVVATVNPSVTPSSSPSNIGRAVGGLCWIVDATNHNRLAPIGVVGELVVEGPILAQGYLKNPDKTAESFITNPLWCSKFSGETSTSERRFYRTGDLARLEDDGSIEFQGRKDNQVKINGQRLELSEIEHHLSVDSAVQSCLAFVPSSGPFKSRLVSVLSLQSSSAPNGDITGDQEMRLVDFAPSQLTSIRDVLAGHLAAYMIPSTWIIVNQIPLLPSGKLDRRRTANWVEAMTSEQHQKVLSAQDQDEKSGLTLDRDATSIETKLRAAWAKALGIAVDSVPFTRSFIRLGGDSISAMQLMAICRASNMAVSVSQIMRSKSIVELASFVAAVEDITQDDEQEDKPFPLSPIQKLYFESMLTGSTSTHFNQSVLLETTRNITARELSNALETVIKTHSMLRARFSCADGVYSQRITSDAVGSYILRSNAGVDQRRISQLIEESQKSLDIFQGPLLASNIIEMEDSAKQVVFFAIHHLVVDVVSWNIILQDLETLLSSPTSRLAKPLSFQTWNSQQLEEARINTLENVFHDIPAPSQDFSYWGMQSVPNLHGDAVTETVEMPAEKLLGSCHEALDTDVVDVLLASLLASFRQTFSDRSFMPSIFNEGHGREPLDNKLDLSRTVGWFTTLCPVYLPESLPVETDLLDMVRWVRDFRRKIPGKGRPYFAYQMLSEATQAPEWPVELAFNFLGQTQKTESEGSIFKSAGSMFDSTTSETDIGADVPRLALIEISASLCGSALNFSFTFNRQMQRQSSIQDWVSNFSESIQKIVKRLSAASTEQQAPDISLLPLAFSGASRVETRLAELGISFSDEVEAAYPCSPVQQGILMAQIRSPEYYSYSVSFTVNPTQPGHAVDVQLLVDAWQRVVQRHSTLRTVFVDGLLEESGINQVVLHNHLAVVSIFECSDDERLQKMSDLSSLPVMSNTPPHHLTVFKTGDKVTCVLEMSHAISDGTSMPILFRDLALAYQQSIPSASISVYRDYVAHLQDQGSHDVKYWQDYLSGAEPCHLPSLSGTAQPKVLRSLDQPISHAAHLQTFCTERGVTLSNLLQLTWALVLQAYTGLDDVCFGYLVAERDVPVSDMDKAIGVFISMLVCRVRFSPSSTIADVLGAVQDDLSAAMSHKNVSLADIQRVTGLANEPLFNTAYSFQRRSVNKSMATGPLSFDVSDAQDPNEYDLTVNAEVWDSAAELQLCYWTDKVSDSQAKNIACTFDQILTSIISSDPALPTDQLNILSDHCAQQLISWNETEPELLNHCVHHVFERNAQHLPYDAPAIEAWDASFSYREVDAAASQLAQHLVSLGVTPETYIPLCFEKSAWAPIAMLAVLKAGAAFVPVDPGHPPERINFLVHNIDAKLILCSPSLVDKFASMNIPTFAVSNETVSSLFASPISPSVQVQPHNAAYVIFTSGTTGVPKGTIIEHAAFTTGGTSHARAIHMTSSSRVLQFASHTFDASIMEILTTFLVGGCVCIPSDEERMNDLAGAIAKYDVNWALLTPSVANVLKPGSVPGLKVLVTGGEAMSRDHITKWSSHAALINAYGPSEASVIAAAHTKVDQHGAIVNREPATIGHAVGCRSWVVDSRNHNRLMPIGSIGELLVEGPIVARGYLSNETKTREAFIDHPSWRANIRLSGDRVDRMYKTGDLVLYNSDGSLNYVSRKDTQIKLNGQRIELGEIEHHVKVNLPAHVQSAVELVVPQSKTSTKALAVFFTSDEPVEADRADLLLPMSSTSMEICQSLKTAIGAALPSHMVPTVYIPVVKMPWTLAGKLDRQRLKAIAQSIPSQQMGSYKLAGTSKSRAPTTFMQRKLQKVWSKILKMAPDRISRDDSFFRLGGDSIGAMKVVSAARMEDVVLTVMDIFKTPVLSELATCCDKSGRAAITKIEPFSLLHDFASPSFLLDEVAQCCGVQPGQIQDLYPCSSLQEGLVASSMQKPGAYVARYVFKVPSSIDIEGLKMAWQRTIDHVDILRSRIVNAQSLKSYQVILTPHEIDWEYYSSLEASTHTSPIPDRNGGVLARYAIVDSSSADMRYFVWTVHHALYDAWSMPSILKFFSDFYHGESTLPPVVPYANFAKYLADTDGQASDEFWKARFQDASLVSHFPTATATDEEPSHASLHHTVQYSKDALGIDITIPTIVRAAWALLLATQTGSDDVGFGETLSGRDIALDHVEDILGPTLTTVPWRVQIDRGATVGHFLSTLHKQAAQVIPHQHAGLQHIKRLGHSIAVACDFRNLLVIQSGDDAAKDQELLQSLDEQVEHKSFFTYPLVVECSIEANKLVLTIHHDETVLTSWQTERLAHQFGALVDQLICLSQEPDRMVSDLQLHSQEDAQMIKQWNCQSHNTLHDTIPSLFWQTVTTYPNTPSIRAWDGHLSYESLAQHAAHLAKHLVQQGVGAEVMVPCCMDKSLWTSVAMLAVILAGGAIVPLDPAHPPARHAEIARECNARIALCSPQYQDRFVGVAETVIKVDQGLFNTPQHVTLQDLPTVVSQNAAFVIYTSGSTGKAKGVVIEHASFIASCRAYTQRMHLTPTSSVFHFTSYAFDIAMGETFGAFTSGACLCVPSEEMRMTDLPGAMNSLGATWAFLTPSLANMQDPSKFTTLQTLVCGGEAMSAETITKWADKVELINGYGPAECTVFAVANAHVSADKDHTNIGRAMDGSHTWIVDPRDHNRLAPVGCEGELLISGPIVSRGYLNDDRKTAQAFVKDPAWMHHFNEKPVRLYKTGDLVKYRPDGSLTYIGRKDNQVKLHGQRMELGEIEACLESDARLRNALVALPKSGIFKGRLVAIVSFKDSESENPGLASLQFTPVSESDMEAARLQVSELQHTLSENLPPYMMPSSWLVVSAIPLLLSGKLDRVSCQRWLADMDVEMPEFLVDGGLSKDVVVSNTTEIGRLLQHVWASVLRVPQDVTPTNRSFISLGGDSIMAMQIMSRCRDHSIKLTMRDIMSGKSITELASLIEKEGRHTQSGILDDEDDNNQPFALSPIQELFFNNSSNKDCGDRFNQSQLFSIHGSIDTSSFAQAIHTLVQKHPMLRARFSKSTDGQWTQQIASDTQDAYGLHFHDVNTTSEMVQLIASSQKSIDISGPVFIVDHFRMPHGSPTVSLIAHHLVVDVVSWINIAQDLETLLSSSPSLSPKPLSFRRWNVAQIEHAKSLENQGEALLPFTVQPADLDFWGMSNAPNNYSQVTQQSFSLCDTNILSMLLNDSHTALRTEPLDLFISSLLQSFGQCFPDRELPTLFNEGHGREPWDDMIDLSQTVGWFTSLCPIHVSQHNVDPTDTIDCVRKVKDLRRSIPSNGRPYFAQRYLTKSGKLHLDKHEPIEVLLNFLGRSQQSGEQDTVLRSIDLSLSEEDMKAISDVGPETRRMALFEISIAILDEGIRFTFMYNKHMLHQDFIQKWVITCKDVLTNMAKELSTAPSLPTLSDFPLMPLDYAGLQEIVDKSLPAAHVCYDEVEDMYPCSPMQKGIILSQLLDPSQYLFHAVLEVSSPTGATIDAAQLASACSAVVERHAALRTIFIESVHRGGSFDQVVTHPRKTRISTIKCREIDVMAKLNTRSLGKTNKKHGQPTLPYQITICETPQGKVFIKLEMNHAVTDGASTSIILRDISSAYTNSLPPTKAPSYKEYIKYISNQSLDSSLIYWKSYLSGARFTEFPTMNSDHMAAKSLGSVTIDFDRFTELHSLGLELGVTFSNIIMVAWALVLRKYTNSQDVCFGYLASGRDARIDGVADIVGPLINMLVFRFQFTHGMLLKRLFLDAQEDYVNSLPHQHFSLAHVTHALGQAKRGFFNTAVSIQNAGSSEDSDLGALKYESVDAFDPSEYAVTLNANTTRGDEGIVFRYWTSVLSHTQAKDLAHVMSEVLSDIIDHSEEALSHLRVSQDSSLPTHVTTSEVDGWTFQHDHMHRAATTPTLTVSSYSTGPEPTLFSPSASWGTLTKDRFQEKLSALWRDHLDIDTTEITYEGSFFEYGGDSIIAMAMVGDARDHDLPLTVADIFKNPTFGSMLKVLRDKSYKDGDMASTNDDTSLMDSKKDGILMDEYVYQPLSLLGQQDPERFVRDTVCPLIGVSRASIIDVLPTTDFQAQAVQGSLLDSRWMLNYFYLDGSGPLDVALLQESITNVTAAFDILRTVFVPYQATYVQVILRHVQPDLTIQDVDDMEQFTSQLESDHLRQPARPERPSLRFIVARQNSSQRHRIFIRLSHALYDGVCFPAILNALKASYEGEPIITTPSYATYICGVRGRTRSEQYTYWRSLLKHSTPTDIIPRQIDAMRTTPTQVLKKVVATPSLAAYNITAATVVKAAWTTVLAKATGKIDVVFGHLISGRNVRHVPGIEAVVGPCLNVVPVRVSYQASWTVLDLLRHIQHQQVDNMPYESLGFREIIRNCTDWNDDGAMGFSTMVQHQSMAQTDSLSIGDNTYNVGVIASQEDTADFSVVTTPQDSNSTEVCFLYPKGGHVGMDFAEQLFDALCDTITDFSKNVNVLVVF